MDIIALPTSRAQSLPREPGRERRRRRRGRSVHSPDKNASRRRSNARPPALEPPFQPVEQRDDHEAGYGENQDAEEQRIGLKHVAGFGDHMAEAGGRGVELADDDTE